MVAVERFLRDIFLGEQVTPNFRADVKLFYHWVDHLAYCKDFEVRVDGFQRSEQSKVFLTTLICGHGVENHVEFTVDQSCWFFKEEYDS